jgi:hypothetical protein
MANTYTLIASSTVGSGGTANIEFTSIPGTYTDLLLKLSLRSVNADVDDFALIKFNTDTGSNYPYIQLRGNGSSASSNSGTLTSAALVRLNGNTATSSTFGSNDVYIPNYTSSNQKSASADGVSENNATAATASFWAALWTGTAAITSLTITANGGNLMQYSTAYLYGISNS